MNLLVAVDLSPASERILAAARELAQAMDADITVLHVAEPNPDFVGFEAGPAVVREQVANEFKREHKAVQELAESLRADGLTAKALLIQGPVVEKILEQAKSQSSAMIVVGSHGHGALFDMLVGSYSKGVLRKSPVPVLVVPTRDE